MGLIRPIFQRRTYRHLLYLALALPLGVFYFVFLVTGVSGGAGLIVIWVGVPILLGVMLAWRGIGTFERRLHRGLLGIDIPEPTVTFQGEGTLWERIKRLLEDSGTWRTLAWLLIRFPAGLFTFIVLVTLTTVAVTFMAAPLLIPLDLDTFARWNIDIQPDFFNINGRVPGNADIWWITTLGVILFIAEFHVINGLAWAHGVVGKALLGTSARQREVVLETRTTELEERTRLAHELHDSIGHAVTLMVVQAGAGRKVFDSDPAFAKESLEIIENTGRSSLGELDRVLGILRSDGAGTIEPPALGLGDLDDLVARVREAELPVSLTVKGSVQSLPRDLQTAAYRIVQEALTNVMRHAGTATNVSVRALGDALDIDITNQPPESAPPPCNRVGRGIIGMRERVAAYGGVSEIGPTPEGGFRVYVRFPL